MAIVRTACTMTLDPKDRILVVGSGRCIKRHSLMLVRYRRNGKLDRSFGDELDVDAILVRFRDRAAPGSLAPQAATRSGG